RVAAWFPERSRHRFQSRQRARIKGSGEKAQLERVERIERSASPLHRLAPPLTGLLHPLQREQRIDAADAARARGRGRGPCRVALLEAEGAGRGTLGRR